MSAIYDNWERLVAAVLKKELLWQLSLAESISPSISSNSSGFSFGRLTSSLDDVPFTFSSPEWFASNEKDGDFGSETAAATPPRKRDLKIEVPILRIEDRGFCRGPHVSNSHLNSSPSLRVNPRAGEGHSGSQTKRTDDAKQQSYPLPLPPDAISNSSHVTRPNSAEKSPLMLLPSPGRAENVKRPGTSWKKGKLISRGVLGDVYLGFNSDKGEMCAMKEVILSSEDAKSKQSAMMLEKEIAILSCIKHPNIVQYFGSEMVDGNFYIFFEFVSGGSIYRILQEYGRLGESAIRSYTKQILSGLAYLHSKSIAHRDIKGANILVDPNGSVKLFNFGLEKHIAEKFHTSWLMDSPYWVAPEVIMNSNVHNLAIDIWSLGCTVLEMATAKPPLSQYKGVMAMFKVANHKELPTIPDHLSDDCKDFLRHCLQWNPLHRATASRLLQHPFVKTWSPLGKQIGVSTPSGHPAATNAVKSEDFDHARSPHQLDSAKVASASKASKSNSQTSDIYSPRNISAPVSPVGSLLPHSRSRQYVSRQMSPPPKSSPHTASTLSAPVSPVGSPLPHPRSRQYVCRQMSSPPKSSPHTASTLSAPVSPVGSPLPNPRSPQYVNRQMSPPPKSSPHTASVLSAPVSPVGSPLPNPRSPKYVNRQMSPSPKSSPHKASALSAPVSPVGSPLPNPRSPQYVNRQISPPAKSNPHTASTLSTPVSLVGSPLPHPGSSQHLNRQMSPPPISSPCTASRPIIGGISATPHPHIDQHMLQQEDFRNVPKHPNIPSYWDPNILRVFRFS